MDWLDLLAVQGTCKSLQHHSVKASALQRPAFFMVQLHIRTGLLVKPQLDYRLAAAAAKSLQSSPTLCDPIDGSPPGFPVHGIFQARVLERGAIAFSGL